MSDERFVIDVARLERDGERFEGELDPAALDYGLVEGDYAAPSGGLVYSLFAQLLGDELLVRGSLRQDFERLCSRCAARFTERVEEPSFTASVEVPAGAAFADLTADLREAILLNFPEHPVCRPDCRGLCPKCGADLNLGPCGCGDSGATDSRWGGLDRLKLQ